MNATEEAIRSEENLIRQREYEERLDREEEMAEQELAVIPKIFLCIDHQLKIQTPLSGLLAHQIDVIRRTGCDCNIEMLWLWYDLCGFLWDSYE